MSHHNNNIERDFEAGELRMRDLPLEDFNRLFLNVVKGILDDNTSLTLRRELLGALGDAENRYGENREAFDRHLLATIHDRLGKQQGSELRKTLFGVIQAAKKQQWEQNRMRAVYHTSTFDGELIS